MKYIDEINSFHTWLLTNSISFSSRLLWYSLMHYCNTTGWKDEFNVAMSALELDTGLSRRTIERARNQLQQNGRISFTSRKGNQSAIYHIIYFVRHTDAQYVAQPVVQCVAQPVAQADHIPRIDKNREDKEKQVKENVVVVFDEQKAIDCYDNNIHPISGEIERDRLVDCIKQYGAATVIRAINTAVGQNKRKLSYIEGILQNWQRDGYSNKNKTVDADAERREILKAYAERKRSDNSKPFAGFISAGSL